MSFRGDVIHWKTNNHPGITTRAGVITNWPADAPFPEPDQATHDIWEAEFIAAGVEQRITDTAQLREAGKDIALVLTELVDWLLANTAMQATDFTPKVKQAYLNLKAIADRVKT